MTCRKTSNYTYALVTCGKNFQLHTGIGDMREKLPRMHGEAGVLVPQHGHARECKKHTDGKRKHTFSIALIAVERTICPSEVATMIIYL